MDLITLALAKKHANQLALGGYTNVTAVENQVRFTMHDGTVVTVTLLLPEYGVSVENLNIRNSHLFCMLSDGTVSIPTNVIVSGRFGNTTHGKQKAVYVYIKATSGLAENAQDNVLRDVKDYVDNANSYSTQEIKTGGTWIDGKPIYRKVLTGSITGTTQSIDHQIENIENYVQLTPYMISTDTLYPSFNTGNYYFTMLALSKTQLTLQTIDDYVGNSYRVILEYTKTTD